MPLSEMIAGIKEKDRRFQQQFFRHYRPRMMIVCQRYIPREEDREEICMDGFVKAFTSIATLQTTTEAGVFSWLRRTMINTCINFLKQRKSIFTISEMEAMNVGFEADFLSKLSADEIRAHIARMPPGYKVVFNLSVMDGYSNNEIAELLRIKPKTVSSQLIKSTNHLQKILIPIGIDYGNKKKQ